MSSPLQSPLFRFPTATRRHDRPARALSALWLALGVVAAATGVARAQADGAPFAIRTHAIQGLIHQVWPLDVSRCEHAAADLLVLATRGGPPDQEKWLAWMPCGSALVPGDPTIVERRLPPETAIVDVATVPDRSGPQLVLVSARGLRIESLDGSQPAREIPIPGGLPLPERPWEISRIAVVDDWHDRGPATALVPSLRGAWLVDLVTGEARALEMPVHASYRTWMPHRPETAWKWMVQEVTWPTVARGDDNGDGRLDLFALSRWAVWIYHSGPDGLPDRPSRQIALAPFDEETERRHESTVQNYLARDIDGDARADLLLSVIQGGITEGRSTTRIFLNPGTGVSIDTPPVAERRLEGGFSGFSFVDVDGDGRDEILETSFEFGVLQMVRFLLTRRAEMQVRILGLDPAAPDGTRLLFEDDLSFQIDFAGGGVTGLLPNLGDWNGDGRLDFYVSRSDEVLGFRLGSKDPDAPLFGRVIGRQAVPLASGQTRAVDLDGDGLDEIVAFDPRDPAAPLVVLENLGRLPGTRSVLEP